MYAVYRYGRGVDVDPVQSAAWCLLSAEQGYPDAQTALGVIFNNGEGVQTANIEGVAHDSYFTFDETNSDKETNFTDITDQYYSPDPVELPACVEEIPGHIYVYFKSNKDYDQPYVWAWDKENNWCKNEWPGDKMEQSSELTVLINEFMKVAVLTDQIPLNQVAPFVTEENVIKKLRMFDRCLKRDFSLTRPRIAILALNPEPGKEEKEILEPLIQKIADEQICAIGPFTAEQFFASRAYTYYDGILAMYYDQCAAPLHLSGSEYCIALQTGENTIKTVPLQDASLDIAGRGEAPISSFCNAIYTALDVHRNRLRYEEAHKNPLPKLFHDKREDSRRDENKRPPKPE